MSKRTAKMPEADKCRHWGIALVVVVATSFSAAMAQSTLRFVDADTHGANIAAQESATIEQIRQPEGSQLRMVEVKDGNWLTGDLTANSTTPQPMRVASTLTLAQTSAKPSPSLGVQQKFAGATELRFVPDSASVQPTAPEQASVPQYVPNGTELFTNVHQPQSQSTTFSQRAAATAEHVPASVPQHFDAQPVRTAREVTPVTTPAGTELFTAVPPKPWNVPALDYGSALRKPLPTQPQVTATKPTQPTFVAKPAPTMVTVKELPAFSATELFSSPPQQIQPEVQPQKPQVSQQLQVASQTKPEQTQNTKATVVVKPTPAPETSSLLVTELFASQPVVKPAPLAAAELDFSQLPATEQRPTLKFEADKAVTVAPPTVPVPQSQPKHTAVAAMPVTVQPFAYNSSDFTNLGQTDQPQLASAKEFTDNQEPVWSSVTSETAAQATSAEPSVYKFRFAAATDPIQVEPVPADELLQTSDAPESLPAATAAAPCACDNGGLPHGGCPYLPGQSGAQSVCGVDCGRCAAPCCSTWSDAQSIPWSLFGPGEYVGPARPAHVDTYYLRVNDNITLTFIESRKKSAEHYRIGVGDRLQIEWLQGAANAELPLNRDLLVQPDGTVTLPLIGETMAAGKTVNEFREEVVKLFSKYQRDPQITVTPISVNVAVQDVLKAVTAKNASSGQTQDLRVTPEGTIQAAGIGSVYVQGLTLDELRSELEARYAATYGPGLTVSPQLTDRATSYVFLGGEVKAPGRYTLEGPTTVMQAIAMAGGWNIGGNVRQVVVFRRDENWCLKATKIDVRAPLYGNDPCPMNDVWLRENDLVLVPKSKILCATDLINLYFTRGVYAVFPINYVYDFSQNSGIVPVP